LASYGVFVALCGYQYDLPNGKISFNPKISRDDFKCFFSTGKGWGVFANKKNNDGTYARNIEVLYGSLDGVELDAG
jgi:hypothetical protein